jgi:hypothetical protein
MAGDLRSRAASWYQYATEERVMNRVTGMVAGAVVLLASACGPAGLTPGELGVSARSAFLEGRTRAATWDSGAQLRWMEGIGISSAGVALPGVGQWRLHYTAPGRTSELMVTVTSLESMSEERAPTQPQGFNIGTRTVGDTWIDSPEAMTRALAARGGSIPERAGLLLVPEETLKWVVTFPEEARRWRLDARTGQVITP